MTIGDIPIFGSRRQGLLGRLARRVATVVLVGAGVGALFLLSHLSRPPLVNEADDQEVQCRILEDAGEEYPGELAECQQKLSRLRSIEHAR